jgi:tetratricopeptide (TPR) repeat protein
MRYLPGKAILLFVLILHANGLQVSAKDTWTGVQSKNFFLIGNASEKQIRQVAMKLEQFRYVFSMLFPTVTFNSPVPTTVIVFKSDSYYKPFKPNPNIAGYFQSGEDVNYITLTSEQHSADNPFRTIFHEYVHLLVNNTAGNRVPVWLNEGLAEYYSTFNVIDDDQKVILGDLIDNHVLFLRDQKFLPLRTLFAVDRTSPYYNEGNKMNVFYAESWMLVHYLIEGKKGQRRDQMAKFVLLLGKNVPVEDAFKQAFQLGFEEMEKELKSYIQGANYMATVGTLRNKLEFDSEIKSAPLSEAEAQAYLGDLLLHTQHLTDAEARLQQALSLDPNLPMAHASLGMLRFRQGRFDEARQVLERAVTANSQNYLAHYYYAYALSRQEIGDVMLVSSYSAETAKAIRAELKKAIELKPDFPESYNLLVFVNLVTGQDLDESVNLLEHALTLSPGKQQLVLMLAQIYMRKEDFKNARSILERIAQGNSDVALSRHARALIDQIKAQEEQLARLKAWRESATSEAAAALSHLVAATNSRDRAENETVGTTINDPSVYLRQALRKPGEGEIQVQGTLLRIDCDAKGITFLLKLDDRLLRLRSDSFEHIDFTTFTTEIAGEISCGPRKQENPIVICFLPSKDPAIKIDGTAKSIEFVPKDFRLHQAEGSKQ